MNTHQLNQLASSCLGIAPTFIGVFASDLLPDKVPRPSSLIANLDSSEQAGSHWVCLYFPTRGLPEYMDSYGWTPSSTFLKVLGSRYRCNSNFLQSAFSAVCGQYCLFFLLQRNRLSSMDAALSFFGQNEHFLNDILVNSFVEEHFEVRLKMFDNNWQLGQLTRSYI